MQENIYSLRPYHPSIHKNGKYGGGHKLVSNIYYDFIILQTIYIIEHHKMWKTDAINGENHGTAYIPYLF